MSFEDLANKSGKMSGKNKAAFDAIVALIKQFPTRYSEVDDELLTVFGWNDNNTSNSFMQSNGAAYKVIEKLIGQEIQTAVKLWERMTDYAYPKPFTLMTLGSQPFRSKNHQSLYVHEGIRIICGFVACLLEDMSTEKFLKSQETFINGMEPYDANATRHNDVFTYLLAMQLDAGDKELVQYIGKVIAARVKNKKSIDVLIQSLFYSHNEDAHKLAVKLLVQESLPEECRNAILRAAGQGTMEGFSCIINAINTHELIELPSVISALCSWFGFDGHTVLSEKFYLSYQQIHSCLTDPKTLKQFLDSDDAHFLYIALCVTGMRSVETALTTCMELLKSDSQNKKTVALHFANKFDVLTFRAQLGTEFFQGMKDNDEPIHIALAGNCFYPLIDELLVGCSGVQSAAKSNLHPTLPEASILFIFPNEIEKVANAIHRIAGFIKGNSVGGRYFISGPLSIVISKDELTKIAQTLKDA